MIGLGLNLAGVQFSGSACGVFDHAQSLIVAGLGEFGLQTNFGKILYKLWTIMDCS